MKIKKLNLKKIDFKNMKLAAKTSYIIGIIMTISLVVLITVSVISVSRRMSQVINGEFMGIATQNGIVVQNIIDSAAGAAQNLQDYLEDSYDVYYRMLEEQPVDAEGNKVPFPSKKSVIYHTDMIELNYEVENYILHNAWSTIRNNPDIIGIAALFEPYAYEDNIQDYTLYINSQDAENQTAQSLGAYGGVQQKRVLRGSGLYPGPLLHQPLRIRRGYHGNSRLSHCL